MLVLCTKLRFFQMHIWFFCPISVSNVKLNGKPTKTFEGSSLRHLNDFLLFANKRQPEYITLQFIIITDYHTVTQVKGSSLLARKRSQTNPGSNFLEFSPVHNMLTVWFISRTVANLGVCVVICATIQRDYQNYWFLF